MPLGQANSKSIAVTYFYIETYNDFPECMNQCAQIGYEGVLLNGNVGGVQSWTLNLDSDVQKGVSVTIGQVLVWDSIKLEVYDLTTFQSRYDVVA